MATKKSNSTKKSTKKTTAKRSAPKAVKAVVKAAPKPKTVHATEPYHPGFGIILLLVCVIIASVLVIAAAKTIIRATYNDAQRFSLVYSQVDEDNVFKYKSAEETAKILEHGTGVVFIGFPSCPWCQAYVPMLDKLAKEYGIEEISYLDVYKDRKENTEVYQKLVSILDNRLQFDEDGNRRIYVPEVVFVIDGTIIGNDHETSKDTLDIADPEEYWTEDRVAAWEEKVGRLFERVKNSEGCTSSCNE